MIFSTLIPNLVQFFLIISHAQLSSISQDSIGKINLLKMFGFDRLKTSLKYYPDEPATHLWDSSFLDEENFQIILDCLTDPIKQFNEDEIEDLVKWGELFLTNGYAMKRILDTFLRGVNESIILLEFVRPFGHISNELKEYLTKSIGVGIQINKTTIELDGWEVAPETKSHNLNLLIGFTPYCTEISIKNLLIDDDTFKEIQLLFHPRLVCVKIENCSFYLSNLDWFDFHSVPELIQFHFSGNLNYPFLTQMLRTISKDNLSHLEISNICFPSERDIDELIITLKQFKNLKHLIATNSFPIEKKTFKFTGNILELSHLITLDLSGNLDWESFFRHLSTLKGELKLEHLNLSNPNRFNGLEFNDKFFLKFAPKFPHLKILDLSGMTVKNIFLLPKNIYKLKGLKEFRFDGIKEFLAWQSFIVKERPLNFPINLINNFGWFQPKSISGFCLSTRIELGKIGMKDLIGMTFPDQFNVTQLKVFLGNYDENISEIISFFSSFKQLTLLAVKLSNTAWLNYLEMLLKNNPIEELEISFFLDFTKFTELIFIIENYKVKILKLEKDYGNNIRLEQFLIDLSKTNILKGVESIHFYAISPSLINLVLLSDKFQKLRSIWINYSGNDDNFTSTALLPTVRNVTIRNRLSDSTTSISYISNLLRIFPNVSWLKIKMSSQLMDPIDFDFLLNLRVIAFECLKLQEREYFLKQLSSLPLLNQFIFLEEKKGDTPQCTIKKHSNFPSLIFSWLETADNQMKQYFGEECKKRKYSE